MKAHVFTKPRAMLGVVLGVGLSAAVAFAAWAIYTGVTGSAGGGKFGTAPTLAALTWSAQNSGSNVAVVPCTTGTGSACTGGTEGTIGFGVVNNAGVTETWNTPGYSFATSDDGSPDFCSTHLFVAADNTAITSVPAGGLGNQTLKYVADPSTPAHCSAATITVTPTGTTSP